MYIYSCCSVHSETITVHLQCTYSSFKFLEFRSGHPNDASDKEKACVRRGIRCALCTRNEADTAPSASRRDTDIGDSLVPVLSKAATPVISTHIRGREISRAMRGWGNVNVNAHVCTQPRYGGVLVAINHGLPHCSPVNHRTRGVRELPSVK